MALISYTSDEVRDFLVTCPIVGLKNSLCHGDTCMAWTWVDDEEEEYVTSAILRADLEKPEGDGWQAGRVMPYIFPHSEGFKFYQHWSRSRPERRGCCGMLMRENKKELV